MAGVALVFRWRAFLFDGNSPTGQCVTGRWGALSREESEVPGTYPQSPLVEYIQKSEHHLDPFRMNFSLPLLALRLPLPSSSSSSFASKQISGQGHENRKRYKFFLPAMAVGCVCEDAPCEKRQVSAGEMQVWPRQRGTLMLQGHEHLRGLAGKQVGRGPPRRRLTWQRRAGEEGRRRPASRPRRWPSPCHQTCRSRPATPTQAPPA